MGFQSTNSTRLLNSDDTDLTTLLHTHFSQIERVSSAEACESCGKQTVLARRMCLKNLAPHVLICLKVFTFCRENQTSAKVMKKITIPERLCVTLSGLDDASKPEIQPSEPFSNEVIFPSEELSEYPTNTILFDTEKRTFSAHSLASSSSYCVSHKTQSVTTRTFKLQGMILHHGVSLHCGHYTCVARVGMEWISFDDAFVHLTSLDQIYSRPLTTPYLLLYTQVWHPGIRYSLILFPTVTLLISYWDCWQHGFPLICCGSNRSVSLILTIRYRGRFTCKHNCFVYRQNSGGRLAHVVIWLLHIYTSEHETLVYFEQFGVLSSVTMTLMNIWLVA